MLNGASSFIEADTVAAITPVGPRLRAALAKRQDALVCLRTTAVHDFLQRAEAGEFAMEHKTPDDVTEKVL